MNERGRQAPRSLPRSLGDDLRRGHRRFDFGVLRRLCLYGRLVGAANVGESEQNNRRVTSLHHELPPAIQGSTMRELDLVTVPPGAARDVVARAENAVLTRRGHGDRLGATPNAVRVTLELGGKEGRLARRALAPSCRTLSRMRELLLGRVHGPHHDRRR
jgi:hypothetical protein